MITVRPSDERGRQQRSWLDSRHTFSFDRYYDPQHMGFRTLRVVNEDWIAGGGRFPLHPHRDMEILTYVVEGALEHQDSLGFTAVVRAGDVQRITAGKGIEHSEANYSATDPVHLLQIWILPDRNGLPPGYEQRSFPLADRRGRFQVLASPDEREGSMLLHQDAAMLAILLEPGERASYRLAEGRHAWVQVVAGDVTLNRQDLREGDGAAVSGEQGLEVVAATSAHVVAFDLA